jgi:profilin
MIVKLTSYILDPLTNYFGLKQGREGLAVAKTTQAIIIAHHSDTAIAGNATSTVEGLADYLIKQGY